MALRAGRLYVKLTYWRVIVSIGLLGGFISGCGPGRSASERRDRPPFVKYERMPDRPEKSILASGPPIGPILRSSEEFKTKLVRSFDTGIVFKDNEGTGADRVMTKRCKAALERLAQAVRDEWEGKVKLRVIEAWDEDAEHASDSLHFEGRALDITTSDRDQSKYGKLATLAYFEARFDWVTYMDGHVHVSCRADGPEDERGHCFSAEGLVRLENGRVKRLEHIEIGDKVLTASQTGTIAFSEVIMFMDRRLDAEIDNYVTIETVEPKRNLSLTENHMVFVASELGNLFEPRFARTVQAGDYLSVVSRNFTTMQPAKVASIRRRRLKGAFAPLTREGTIIVNDVLASSYALIDNQKTAHQVFLPWRYLSTYTQQAISNKDQVGLHWYVHILRTLNYLFGVYANI